MVHVITAFSAQEGFGILGAGLPVRRLEAGDVKSRISKNVQGFVPLCTARVSMYT